MDSLLHEPASLTTPQATAVQPIRVLMVGPDLAVRGGISAVERLLIDNLPAHVTATHIASMVEGSQLTKLRTFLTGLARTRRELDTPTDLVHIHFASRASNLRKQQFARLAQRRHVPVILHAHGGGFRDYWRGLGRWQRHQTHRMLTRANALIVLGSAWAEFFAGIGVAPERIVILPNPVALPLSVPPRNATGQILFVYLGLVSREKGAFDLVSAIARLAPAVRERLRVVVAGNGALTELRAACHQALLSNIEVREWLDIAARDALLKRADAFVLPSYHEGLPMSLLEAMAWGLPPICTPVGSIPEVVQHGLNGLLVPAGDIVQLATALQRLTQNTTERLRMGSLARARVEPLALDHYLERLGRVYAAVAATGLPPRSLTCS
jgi:glycosyltransferase involved in cell wall biosynthesis